MHLDEYVRQVHDSLGAAAALGDERTQQVAAGLAGAAEPAVRLAILGALTSAAQEITAALLDSPGAPTVTVRLDGDDVRVEVIGSEPQTPPDRPDNGDASARISLRLPESLKADVEQAAAREGVSVNTWLVRAADRALSPGWPGWGGWAGPGGHQGHPGHRGGGGRRGGNPNHVSGWING